MIHKKYLWLTLLIPLVFCGLLAWKLARVNPPEGKIVLRIRDKNKTNESEIIVIDGNGNNVHWAGNFEGSPTWSPDGKLLAVGCEEDLCILKYDLNSDIQSDLNPQNNLPQIAYTLQIPETCNSNIQYGMGYPYQGILSLSWSPDGQNLAVVCGSEELDERREVCIVSLANEYHCWDEEIGKTVYRIAWSPVNENLLAISGNGYGKNPTSMVFIVDSNGENLEYVADGWSPEWSPSGEEIVYIQKRTGGYNINVINKDGSNNRSINIPAVVWDRPIHLFFDSPGISGSTRLSWSPDGNYIVFASSHYPGAYTYKLYRLNIKTGDIVILLDYNVFTYPAESDWGPR